MDRIIEWINEINKETTATVLNKIKELMSSDPKAPINLYVTSSGGEYAQCASFYDRIKLWKPNIITIGTGHISSAAIIVWLAGKERYVTKHTHAYFHEPYRMFSNCSLDTSEMKGQTKWINLITEQYTSIIVKSSNGRLTKKKVRQMLEKEDVLTPSELVEVGLAHKII